MLKVPSSPGNTRRSFLRHSSIAGAGLLLPVLAGAQQKPAPENDKPKGDENISPAEDLMREHGVLNRILLIYDDHLRKLAAKRTFDGSVLASAADIVRHFIEEYHEKLEEDFLFPRFRKAGKLVNLVDTLQTQHKAGRDLTAKIKELAGTATLSPQTATSWVMRCVPFCTCIGRTRRARIPCSSQRFVPSSRLTNTTHWVRISRRKKMNCLVTTDFSRWSIRWQGSKKGLASMS